MKKLKWDLKSPMICALLFAATMNGGCVSTLLNEASEVGGDVTKTAWDGTKWVGGKVWDGTKWVAGEAYYGVSGNRPVQLDLNDELFANGDHTAAYWVDPAAQKYLAYAFDIGLDRNENSGKERKLSTDEVDWLLWFLDGPEKDLRITTKDVSIAYPELVILTASTVKEPIGITLPDVRDSKEAPPKPSWVQ